MCVTSFLYTIYQALHGLLMLQVGGSMYKLPSLNHGTNTLKSTKLQEVKGVIKIILSSLFSPQVVSALHLRNIPSTVCVMMSWRKYQSL